MTAGKFWQQLLKRFTILVFSIQVYGLLPKAEPTQEIDCIEWEFMPGTKNKKGSKKKMIAVVDPKVGNYEKHPFFVKKANEAKNLLKSVGLPKKTAKAK